MIDALSAEKGYDPFLAPYAQKGVGTPFRAPHDQKDL